MNLREDVGSKLGKMAGVIRRGYVADQKNLLREIGIKNIKKGDGPNATTLFDKLRLTHNEKGKLNGAKFDVVKIIVLKGKILMYTENAKMLYKVNEFKELVEKAKAEHKKTAPAVVEETLSDLSVNDDLTNSVLRNSIENLESFIKENVK